MGATTAQVASIRLRWIWSVPPSTVLLESGSKVSAVCGLLCLGAQRECSRTWDWRYSFCIVVVANKTCKELSPLGLTDLWQPFLRVKADEDAPSGFQVFAHFWGDGHCFALYSSIGGVWSAVTVLQGVVDYGLSVLASVMCNGVRYLRAGWKKIEVMVSDAVDGTMLRLARPQNATSRCSVAGSSSRPASDAPASASANKATPWNLGFRFRASQTVSCPMPVSKRSFSKSPMQTASFMSIRSFEKSSYVRVFRSPRSPFD